MTVGYRQIAAAQLHIARQAFAGLDVETWRITEGIDSESLRSAAAESANDTVEEIAQMLADGEEFGDGQLREFLCREFETAFQVGWICKARADADAEPAPE